MPRRPRPAARVRLLDRHARCRGWRRLLATPARHAGPVPSAAGTAVHGAALQRYWIKDIDTGNVYVVGAEVEKAAAARGPLEAGVHGAEAGRVTELLSGRELRWAGA